MSAALEHPLGPTTIEDWLAQEHPTDGSRLELIYGYPHLTPAPSGQHQYAASNLAHVINQALRDGRRNDLHAVPGVGVEINTGWRTALIPDIVVLNVRPMGTIFQPMNVLLAVEVWSPGNTRTERDTKIGAYAGASVQYFWEVHQDRIGSCTVTAYYLENGRYAEELVAGPGSKVTIRESAPVPVTFDPAELSP